MPNTRKTYARKKSEDCAIEDNKENIVRQSKVDALKKIEENLHDDSFSFTMNHKKPPDSFDLLCSSPMKQEVNFKPLSFWSKKVKDLESKENMKKKKCELYDLSETDSTSSPESKKTKKKRRNAVHRPIKKRNINKLVCHYNTKDLMKKPQPKVNTQNKEGSIIRERIILRRLNEKFSENEEKFSLNKISAFGLTSTPGKSDKINLVGGSTFDFLSPIAPSVPLHRIETEVKKNSLSIEEKTEQSKSFATPKRLRRKGGNEKVVTNGLNRVSDSGDKCNDLLECSYWGLKSFVESQYIDPYVVNCDSKTGKVEVEVFPLSVQGSFMDLDSVADEENEINKTFLNIGDDCNQSEEDIDQNVEEFESFEAGFIENSCNKNSEIIQTLTLLQALIRAVNTSDSQIDRTVLSYQDPSVSKSFCFMPLLSVSQPIGKDQVKLEQLSSLESDSTVMSIKDTEIISRHNETEFYDTVVRRNSFSNVTVRRNYNLFLNFRRSANEPGFNLTHDVNTENISEGCVAEKSCAYPIEKCASSDFENDVSGSFNLNEKVKSHKLECLENCEKKFKEKLLEGDTVKSASWSKVISGDQQTHGHKAEDNIPNIEEFGSNQYRSKTTSPKSVERFLETYSDAGNDSSIFVSSPDTSIAAEECSVCKNRVSEVEERRDSDSGVSLPVLHNPQKENVNSSRERETTSITGFRVSRDIKCYNKVTNTGKRDQRNLELSITNNSPLKTPAVQQSILGDVTFSEEFDFPLPIFESTTCKTPVRRTTGKNYPGDEEKLPDKTFQDESCDITVQQAKSKSLDLCESKVEVEGEITSFRLKPGKKWARSAQILKKALNGTLALNETQGAKKGKMYQTLVEEVLSMQTDSQNETILNLRSSVSSMADVTNKMSQLTIGMRMRGNRTVKVLDDVPFDEMNTSFRSIFMSSIHDSLSTVREDKSLDKSTLETTIKEIKLTTAKDHVLMHCNQEEPLPFEEYFNEKTLKNCKKIGEGTFGEVFMCNSNRVIKIMPIEGPDEVNGEPQKKFDEILSEIVIAMELSRLRNTANHRTSGFCELKRCWCVIGKFPEYLIDLWLEFDCAKGSENDSPVMFKEDQLYIVLEFGNGGKCLESFVFSSAEQSLSILIQLIYSLAVAEKVLEFEHRDMHWGNILIAPTKEKYFQVMINNKEYKLPTKGVKVTIIDFTLSRISYDGCSIYNDLSLDPTLFISKGDYQFEIYRMMKQEVMNDWSLFRPKTNLFWLHYVADKMLNMVHYKRTNTKVHNINLHELEDIKSTILKYSSCGELALDKNFSF